MKRIKPIFKSGTSTFVPYSYKFYIDLNENISKGHKVIHPSATIQIKEILAIIYEVIEDKKLQEV